MVASGRSVLSIELISRGPTYIDKEEAMPADGWKVALVGVKRGVIYGRHFAAHPRCTVVACCDVSDEALARFQQELALPDDRCFTAYEDMLSAGADVVFIGSPIPQHADQAIAAVEMGAHVLSEVTAADSVEECARIVEAVKRTGRRYMLAENCCYWPFVRQWQRMVGDGRLGQIMYAECEYLHPIPSLLIDHESGRPRWRATRAPIHYCSHSLGPILQITGDRITRALGLGQGHRIMPEVPEGGIDIQLALFETENGAIIKLLRSSVAPRHPAIHYYVLQGTRGFVETDRGGAGGTGYLYVQDEMDSREPIDCPIVDVSLPANAAQSGHGTAEYAVVQDFVEALDSGRKPSIDEVRAMDMTVPGLIAHQSAQAGGQWLEVPSFA